MIQYIITPEQVSVETDPKKYSPPICRFRVAFLRKQEPKT